MCKTNDGHKAEMKRHNMTISLYENFKSNTASATNGERSRSSRRL